MARRRAAATGTAAHMIGRTPLAAPTASVPSSQPDCTTHALPSWRQKLRTPLLRWQERELPYLVSMQKRCRTAWLDAYFVNSSLLGSHTFFVLFIPLFFWFDCGNTGRGLFYTLAGGGYWISIFKDLLSIPRPASPPLVRLSTGNHDQMYGFPSAHSNTSVSMATFFAFELAKLDLTPAVRSLLFLLLVVFAGSITFGRIYTGMHSMVDVLVGSGIAIASAFSYQLQRERIDIFTACSPFYVTSMMTPATIFMAMYHPEPLEPCPCFDEAISFISVAYGMLVGRSWSLAGYSLFGQASAMTPSYVRALVGTCFGKVILGTTIIFAWRTLGKKIANKALVPAIHYLACCRPHSDHSDYEARRTSASAAEQALSRVCLYAGLGYIASIAIPDLFVSLSLPSKSAA